MCIIRRYDGPCLKLLGLYHINLTDFGMEIFDMSDECAFAFALVLDLL